MRNTIGGPVSGTVIQTGAIHGDVTVHTHESSRTPANDQQLRDALAHVTVRTAHGTGVFLAPGMVLTTTAAGATLTAADHDDRRYALLNAALDHDDELIALYHPAASQGTAEIRWIELRPGEAEHTLRVLRGSPSPGYAGAPVLNWRTGAVCGVLAPSEPGQPGPPRLLPISTVLGKFSQLLEWHGRHTLNVNWLNVLHDEQLRAGGWRYPNRRLRRYLADAAQADTKHPYAELLSHAPPLHEVYLTQQAIRRPEPDEEPTGPVSVDQILRDHAQVQIVGGPGAGKSSLVRHVIGLCARQWHERGVGEFVAVSVSAEALSAQGSLPDKLAAGLRVDLVREIGRDQLSAMFGREPIPGVPWLILVDGLDEIPPWKRRWALRAITEHRGHSARYRFLVTTRPLGDLPGLPDEQRYPSFLIERFDEAARLRFAVRWFQTVRRVGEDDATAAATTFIRQVEQALPADLVGIPLILTMLCILYDEYPADDLPHNQAALYKKFVTWLRGKVRTDDLVTALAELVHNRGKPAVDAVAMLGQRLDQLLEWAAHERQLSTTDRDRAGSSLLTYACQWPACRPGEDVLPAKEWTEAVTEALRTCGLVIERNGEFVFLHQTVQEYLAAAYIDKARKRRPFAARREFRPQEQWPWPDLQVKLFLAAMWTDRIHRPLRRLLKPRHRATNLGFVVQLARSGLELEFNVRSMAIRTLQALIRDRSPETEAWQQYVGWLNQLDQGQAVATLRAVLDDTRDRVSETRLFDAMRQLAELDRADALARTEVFVRDQSKTGEARMRMARLAANVDADRGTAAFAALAGRPEIGRLRLEAALWVTDRDPVLGPALLASIRDDHDAEDALRISAALAHARSQPRNGIPRLIALGQDGSLQWTTHVRLVRDVIPVDRTAAAQIYTALVRDRDTPVDERITVLRELATEFELFSWFAELAHEALEEAPLRVAVAWLLASYSAESSARALRTIAEDGRVDDLDRATAAQLVDLLSKPVVEPVALDGIGVYDVNRLAIASAVLRVVGSSAVVPLFVALAEDPEESQRSRVAAATAILDLDSLAALRVHFALVRDPAITGAGRFEIARTVATRYGNKQARPLFRALADAGVPFDIRMLSIGELKSGERADRYVELSKTLSESGQHRLAAAQAALRDDRGKGIDALVGFVESWGGFTLRMDAIRSIPTRPEQVRLYSKLAATHRYAEGDRLAAAKAAATLGTTVPLRKLAADFSLSRGTRKAAQDALDEK